MNLPQKSKFFGNFNRKSKFLGNCLKNRNSSEICVEKSKFFVKLSLKKVNSSETCLENRNFLWNYLKKSKFFTNLPWKSESFVKLATWKKSKFFVKFPWKIDILFVKLPEKIEIFRNQNFFTRIHDPPDFKPDWRRWLQRSNLTVSKVMLITSNFIKRSRLAKEELVNLKRASGIEFGSCAL